MHLEQLYTETYYIAKTIQEKEQSGEQVDGRKEWQKIESKIEHIKINDIGLTYNKENLEKNISFNERNN
jgi:hypothetical protein